MKPWAILASPFTCCLTLSGAKPLIGVSLEEVSSSIICGLAALLHEHISLLLTTLPVHQLSWTFCGWSFMKCKLPEHFLISGISHVIRLVRVSLDEVNVAAVVDWPSSRTLTKGWPFLVMLCLWLYHHHSLHVIASMKPWTSTLEPCSQACYKVIRP